MPIAIEMRKRWPQPLNRAKKQVPCMQTQVRDCLRTAIARMQCKTFSTGCTCSRLICRRMLADEALAHDTEKLACTQRHAAVCNTERAILVKRCTTAAIVHSCTCCIASSACCCAVSRANLALWCTAPAAPAAPALAHCSTAAFHCRERGCGCGARPCTEAQGCGADSSVAATCHSPSRSA